MPDLDPNGAARRPVLKRVEPPKGPTDSDYDALLDMAASGKLWLYVGEFEGRGGAVGEGVAVDNAHREHGPGIYQPFDAGSWGRGYWRG